MSWHARVLLAVCLLLFETAGAWAIGTQDAIAPDPDDKPIAIRIWYPTAAGDDSRIEGSGLPLIVISHGTGGTLSGHTDTAIALAEAGFVVAAPDHTGDNYKDQSYVAQGRHLVGRPRHVSRVIDYMLSTWPEHARLDPRRIGVFGHSAGGFTALVAAGGTPDATRGRFHCQEQPDAWDCQYLKQHGVDLSSRPAPPPTAWVHDPRLKAIAVAAPCCGYMFEPKGLAQVRIPVQLWIAEKDTIVDDSPAIIGRLLPRQADLHLVTGAGHFSFLRPCDEREAAVMQKLQQRGGLKDGIDPCADPDGFDRAAFHRDFNAAIVAFFGKSLAPRRP